MNYTHAARPSLRSPREERYQIYALKKAGHTQSEIANVLERSPSTISRELSKNTGGRGYRPKQAHRLATGRRAMNVRKIDDATWEFAQTRLLEDWSLEQISNHAAISIETVYQRVYADRRTGGLLWQHLRCQKLRRKRYGKHDRRGTISNRQSIEERPAVVDARSRIGDWEADTVIGKNHKQAIVSLVERKSGFTMIRKVKRKTARAVRKAAVLLLKPHRDKVHTLASDNGKEFSEHEQIARPPTHELQQLGGWKTGAMVERCAHLAPDHLANAAARLDSVLDGYDLATTAKK